MPEEEDEEIFPANPQEVIDQSTEERGVKAVRSGFDRYIRLTYIRSCYEFEKNSSIQ